MKNARWDEGVVQKPEDCVTYTLSASGGNITISAEIKGGHEGRWEISAWQVRFHSQYWYGTLDDENIIGTWIPSDTLEGYHSLTAHYDETLYYGWVQSNNKGIIEFNDWFQAYNSTTVDLPSNIHTSHMVLSFSAARNATGEAVLPTSLIAIINDENTRRIDRGPGNTTWTINGSDAVIVATDDMFNIIGLNIYIKDQSEQIALIQPNEEGQCQYSLTSVGYEKPAGYQLLGWKASFSNNSTIYYYQPSDILSYPCSDHEAITCTLIPLLFKLSYSGVTSLTNICRNEVPVLVLQRHEDTSIDVDEFSYSWQEAYPPKEGEDYRFLPLRAYTTGAALNSKVMSTVSVGLTSTGAFDKKQMFRSGNAYRCQLRFKDSDAIFNETTAQILTFQDADKTSTQQMAVMDSDKIWRPAYGFYVRTAEGWHPVNAGVLADNNQYHTFEKPSS